jgi:hypothetical protein
MENLNFDIDKEDLKVLFIHVSDAYKGIYFEKFVIEAQNSYLDYFNRNMNNLQKYGTPKTFSQWVNAQIIALT